MSYYSHQDRLDQQEPQSARTPVYDAPGKPSIGIRRDAFEALYSAAGKSRPNTTLSGIQRQLAEAVGRRRHSLSELERIRGQLVPTDFAGMLDPKALADAEASKGFIADTQSLLDEINELDKQIEQILGSLHELVS